MSKYCKFIVHHVQYGYTEVEHTLMTNLNIHIKIWENCNKMCEMCTTGTLLKGWLLKSSIKEVCQILRGGGGLPQAWKDPQTQKLAIKYQSGGSPSKACSRKILPLKLITGKFTPWYDRILTWQTFAFSSFHPPPCWWCNPKYSHLLQRRKKLLSVKQKLSGDFMKRAIWMKLEATLLFWEGVIQKMSWSLDAALMGSLPKTFDHERAKWFSD